ASASDGKMGQTRNRNRRTLENRRSEGGAVSLKEWKEKRQLSGLTHFMLYGTGFQTWEYSPDFALRSYSYVALHAFPAFLYSWLLQSNKMLVFYFLRWILAFVCALCEGHLQPAGVQRGSHHPGVPGAQRRDVPLRHRIPPVDLCHTHFMLYGTGFQTWEYSPDFALRSYSYIALHAFPAFLYSWLLQSNKMLVFYFLRWILAFVCALCEVPVIYIDSQMYGRLTFPALNIVLYNVFRGGSELYGTEPWTYYIVNGLLNFNVVFLLGLLALPLAERFLYPVYPLLCLGAGTALDVLQKLYFCLYAHLRWGEEGRRLTHYLHHTNWIAAVTIVASGLLGLSRILAVHVSPVDGVVVPGDGRGGRRVHRHIGRLRVALRRSAWVPVIYIDSQMYGRLTFPALNIVLYNVFRGGSELYGTEPWTYYIVNGLLNFNVVFLLGLLALPLAMLIEHLTGAGGRTIPYPLAFLGLYLWLGVFLVQPHKEERFLYPVYPLLCLGAGTALDVLQKLYFCLYAHLRWGEEGRRLTHYLHHTNWIAAVTIVASGLLGLSRILAVFRGYHAPMEAFMEVNQLGMSGEVSLDKPINVCLGKEWHRFPSHFFLPSSQWKAQFLRSEFRGQLPQHYSQAPDATSVPPPHMNDRNVEEPSRYVEPWMCEFLVDVEFADGETEAEPHFSADTENWTLVKSWPFLDAARSPQFLRAFYVPFLTPEYCEYGSYVLLRSTRRKRRRPKGS
ncbi:unnamed protein product, partial [Darwinula stevensoni]